MAFERRNLRPTDVVYFVTIVVLLFKGAVSESKESNLSDDYKELMGIVKLDTIVGIVRHCNETSDEARELLIRLQDPDIVEYGRWLYGQSTLHDALKYLVQHGVPGYEVLNKIVTLFNWPQLEPNQSQEHHQRRRSARSVQCLSSGIRECIPPLQVFSFYNRKMRTSKQFKDFIAILKSDECKGLVLKAMEHKGYKKLTQILEDGGFDMDSFSRSMTIMFGWGRREKKKHGSGIFSKLLNTFFKN